MHANKQSDRGHRRYLLIHPSSLNTLRYPCLSDLHISWEMHMVGCYLSPFSVQCAIDNEEFYEQEKPMSLKDVRCLIVIMRQLQDWNNRRQFTPPSDFHADGVNGYFISQAVMEGTKTHDILKQAPFLIPFTSRVKIFASRVTFVNEFGVEEVGIDGGGIFKDFMENITRAVFDVPYGLFKVMAEAFEEIQCHGIISTKFGLLQMRGRSYSYSPSPPRDYGRRCRNPSPRGHYGGRGRDLPTSLLAQNLRNDCSDYV
ncbi:hypothetical protein REPUB_Repub11eG0068100 [Reevesia pubescens]